MKKLSLLCLILFFVNINFSQVVIYNKFNTIINSDLINYNPFLNSVKVSLYNPILALSDADNYASPALDYYLGEYKKELSPFGSNSIDYLPINNLLVSKLELLNENVRSSFGEMRITKLKFSDEPRLNVHLFLGGETGDPMHHKYTRDKFSNRNKIQPSGEFVLSNSVKNFSYRIFGGFNGYFTQQDQNIIITKLINEDEFSEPNKKINLGADLFFGINGTDKINLSAGVIYNSAFEFSSALPFINFTTHKNYYLYTSYYNSYTGIKFKIKAENLESEISKSDLWNLTQFSETLFLAKAEREIVLNKLKFNLFGEVGKEKIKTEKSLFFSDDYNGNKYGAGLDGVYDFDKSFTFLFGVNYQNQFSEEALNFSTGVRYKTLNSLYCISFKILNRIPGIYDRFQKFAIAGNNQTIEFLGINNLKNERLEKLELSYKFSSEKAKIHFEPSYNISDNRIIWANESEQVWKKFNSQKVEFINFIGQFDFSISDKINFSSSYKFSSKSEDLQVPSHRVKVGFDYEFDIDARVKVEAVYRSEIKKWNFIPNYGNWINLGSDYEYKTETPDFLIVNLSWDQNLPVILGLKDIRFAIRCENIFDKYVRYHPSSCEFPRNFTFNLFFSL